jgi:outer membrane receptor protein involved in Fe transport
MEVPGYCKSRHHCSQLFHRLWKWRSPGARNGGAFLPGFANTDLTWESVTTSGVGIDAVLLQNKLNLTVEYYNRLTTGIIQQVNAPYSAGIQDAIDLNVGEVRNRGMEYSASYNTAVGRLRLGFNANFYYSR